VDLVLFAIGAFWGGYEVYRDEAPHPTATGPTPDSQFYSSLPTLPRNQPIAEAVIGYATKSDLRFSEDECDVLDAWFAELNEASVPSRNDRSFVRRQLFENDKLTWHVEARPPGPVISVDEVVRVHDLQERGTAADLRQIYEFWTRLADFLPALSRSFRRRPTRIGVALQPYPSTGGPIIDLWFGDLPKPASSGAAGNVPPWCEVFPISRGSDRDFVERAARSLLRHYGYRRVDETIDALKRSR
jgi:hypothetical protein